MEATQVSYGWMFKHVYPYNGLLSSLRKEGNSDTCHNIDEPWKIMLSEISLSQKDKYCMSPHIWDF